MKIGVDGQIFNMQNFGGISRYCSLILDQTAWKNIFPRPYIYPLFSSHSNYYLSQLISQNKIQNWLVDSSNISIDIYHATYSAGDPPELDIPIVSNLNDMIPELFPRYFTNGNPHLNKLNWFKASQKILSISRSSADNLMQFNPSFEHKIEVIHLFSHLSEILDTDNNLSSSFLNLKLHLTNVPFFLFVGNRHLYKNGFLALSSFAQAYNQSKEKLFLVFVGGESPSLAEQKFIVENNLQDCIYFLRVSDPELVWLYKNSSLVLIPSLAEGFCLPLVESLMFDTPILCSNIPVHYEVSGDFSTFITSTNHQEWSYHILNYAKNKSPRYLLGDSNYNKKLAYFSRDRFMKSLNVLYNRTLL